MLHITRGIRGGPEVYQESSLRPLMRLLGNKARLRLLFTLTAPPMTVGEMADAAELSDQSARYHVHKLVDAGLLDADDQVYPRQYRPSSRVQIVRYRDKTVCSVDAEKPGKIIFTIRDTQVPHKSRARR